MKRREVLQNACVKLFSIVCGMAVWKINAIVFDEQGAGNVQSAIF